VKGKVYRACIQSFLGYASETLAMKVEDTVRLERTERLMVRWICGVYLKNRTASAELNSRLALTALVRRSRLRWFVHVERKESDDWISASRSYEINGVRDRGRSRKS